MLLHVFLVGLLIVAGAAPDDDSQEPSRRSRLDARGGEELNEEERSILDALSLDSLLDTVDAENGSLDILQLEEVLHLVSVGTHAEKPVEEALEGSTMDFLLLTPDVLIDEFGDGTQLTRAEFRKSIPTILSCLTHMECALITDADFVEEHDEHGHGDEEHGHDHEDEHEHGEHEGDHDNHGDEHEHDHDEHEGHEHDHDHDEHEGHEHDHDHDAREEQVALNSDEHDEHEGHEDDEHEGHEHDEHEDDDDEDDSFDIKMIALSVLFVEALFGAMIPVTMGTFKGFKKVLSVLNCFAGGVLLSTGLVHLIPHVIEYENEVEGLDEYPLGLVVVSISFVLMFYFEHVLVDVHALMDEDENEGFADSAKTEETPKKELPHNHNHSSWIHLGHMKDPIILLAATAAHSILEALVVGIENDSYTVWLLFASIAGHKGVTAMALSSRFAKCNATTKEALFFALIFALTAPVSILIGISLNDVPVRTNLILTALATGTFLYIGAYEVINEEFQDSNHGKPDEFADSRLSKRAVRHIKFAAIVAGLVMISLVALIPHEHDHDHHDHH